MSRELTPGTNITFDEVTDPTKVILNVPTPNVQVFTSSGTWTKPNGATTVHVLAIGGGGGGGSGRKAQSGTVRCGGGGGAGGGLAVHQYRTSDLPATVPVTIGAGGTGGPSVSANTTSGTTGTAGSSSIFG